jgi:hypothetical protein
MNSVELNSGVINQSLSNTFGESHIFLNVWLVVHEHGFDQEILARIG